MDPAWIASLAGETICAGFAARSPFRRWLHYLGADILLSLGMMAVSPKTTLFGWLWIGHRVIASVFLVRAVLEAVSVEARQRTPGDRSLEIWIRGRGLVAGALVATVLIGLVSPALDWSSGYRSIVALWRVTTALIAGWLVAVIEAGWLLPVSWKPAARHRWFLLAYVAVPMVLSAAMDAAGSGWVKITSRVHLLWTLGCYLVWPWIVASASKNRARGGRIEAETPASAATPRT